MQKIAGMSLCRILLEASLKGESVGSGLDIGFHTKTLGNMPICPVATSLREGDIARHLLIITTNHILVAGNARKNQNLLLRSMHIYTYKGAVRHVSKIWGSFSLSLSRARAARQHMSLTNMNKHT